MTCEEFREKVMEYIENELSAPDMEEIDRHLEHCCRCRKVYERRIEIVHGFNEVLSHEDISFKSRKSNIMNSIDRDRYKHKSSNKLRQIILNNKRSITQIAAAILIMAIIPAALKEIGFFSGVESLAEKSKGNEAVAESDSSKGDMIFDGYYKEGAEENNRLETEDLKQEDLSLKLNNLRNDSTLELKAWDLEFAGEDIIVFSNYNNILVYSNGQKKIVSLIKVENLNLQKTLAKEPIQLRLKVSADGNYAFVGSKDSEGNILLVDLLEGSYINAGNGKLVDLEVSWSSDSSWAVTWNKKTNKPFIYNVKHRTFFPLENKIKENFEHLFISDDGSLALQGKESYMLKAPDYTEGFLLLGKALGFKDNKPLSIKQDTIYYNSEKGAEKFIVLDGEYENRIFQQQGEEVLITSGGEDEILNLNTKVIRKQYEKDKPKDLKKSSFSSEENYIDKDTLIYIRLIEEAKSIGQFQIVKYDVSTGEETVLYDNSR